MRERPTIMQVIQKWINKGINAIFGLAALLVLYVLAQIFLFATFKIPSNSMEPTLMEGDIIYRGKRPIYIGCPVSPKSKETMSWFSIILIKNGINGMK